MASPAITLRPYQHEVISGARVNIRELRAAGDFPRVGIVLPTGAGKTFVISTIAAGAANNGRHVGIIAPNGRLAQQNADALDAMGLPYGLVWSERTPNQHPLIQVCTAQTLRNRLDRYDFGTILIDECHHSQAATWLKIINRYAWYNGPRGRELTSVIGLTATWCRLDGKPLGDIYKRLVVGPSPAELQEMINPSTGLPYLCGSVAYLPQQIDITGVKVNAGDYVTSDLAAAADKSRITGCAIEQYRTHADGKRAIVYEINVARAERTAADFRQAGYNFVCVYAKTPELDRKRAIDALAAHEIDGIVNVDLFGEGLDVPAIECVVDLRPSKSFSLVRQHYGRGLRQFPGKSHLIILDLAGNIGRVLPGGMVAVNHGWPEDEVEWSLDAPPKVRRDGDSESAIPVRQCPQCFHAHRVAACCPRCGYVYEAREREIEQVDGTLVKMTRAEVAAMKAAEKVRRAEEKAAAREAKKAAREKEKAEGREFRRVVWGSVARASTFDDAQRVADGYGMKPGYARIVWERIGRRITGRHAQEAVNA